MFIGLTVTVESQPNSEYKAEIDLFGVLSGMPSSWLLLSQPRVGSLQSYSHPQTVGPEFVLYSAHKTFPLVSRVSVFEKHGSSTAAMICFLLSVTVTACVDLLWSSCLEEPHRSSIAGSLSRLQKPSDHRRQGRGCHFIFTTPVDSGTFKDLENFHKFLRQVQRSIICLHLCVTAGRDRVAFGSVVAGYWNTLK